MGATPQLFSGFTRETGPGGGVGLGRIQGRPRVGSLWPVLTQPHGRLLVGLQVVMVTTSGSQFPHCWNKGARPVDLWSPSSLEDQWFYGGTLSSVTAVDLHLIQWDVCVCRGRLKFNWFLQAWGGEGFKKYAPKPRNMKEKIQKFNYIKIPCMERRTYKIVKTKDKWKSTPNQRAHFFSRVPPNQKQKDQHPEKQAKSIDTISQ